MAPNSGADIDWLTRSIIIPDVKEPLFKQEKKVVTGEFIGEYKVLSFVAK